MKKTKTKETDKLNINKITNYTTNMKSNYYLDFLNNIDAGLCVDVGAAMGFYTKKMAEIIKPKGGKVYAFEPFTGNHLLFKNSTCDFDNIYFSPKAVADTMGYDELQVSKTVVGGEESWENCVGYSSLGFLKNATNRSIIPTETSQFIEVETTTIDQEFKNITIDCMKIDVQGCEIPVLKGAKEHLKKQQIKTMWIEWGGEPEIIKILSENNYKIYDSEYLLFKPFTDQNINDLKLLGVEDKGFLPLSTGEKAFIFQLKNDLEFEKLIQYLNINNLNWQTDIFAINSDLEPAFLDFLNCSNSL